jgi:hypothetical protein
MIVDIHAEGDRGLRLLMCLRHESHLELGGSMRLFVTLSLISALRREISITDDV